MVETEPMSENDILPVPLFDAGFGGYEPSSAMVYLNSANDRIMRANTRIERLAAEISRLQAEIIKHSESCTHS